MLKVGMILVGLSFASRQVVQQALDFGHRGLPAPNCYVAVGVVWAGTLLIIGSAFFRAPTRLQKQLMALGAMTYPLYLFHNVAGALFTDRLSRYWPAGLALAISTLLVLVVVAFIALVLEPLLRKALTKRARR